jgi:ATP phosphoribosyltransferase
MGFKPRARPGDSGAGASNGSRPLLLALPKGRLARQVARIFEAAGYDLGALATPTRKLWVDCGRFRVLTLRGRDVATYVSHGIADAGVVGSDVLAETGPDLYEPLDLGVGKCRLVVAEHGARPVDLRSQAHLRVATKYPEVARRHYQRRGVPVEIVKLAGALELGPLLGLAEQIVDLVETGETLRQNGLVEVETLMDVSARLVVNRAAFRLRGDELGELIDRLAAVCPA